MSSNSLALLTLYRLWFLTDGTVLLPLKRRQITVLRTHEVITYAQFIQTGSGEKEHAVRMQRDLTLGHE